MIGQQHKNLADVTATGHQLVARLAQDQCDVPANSGQQHCLTLIPAGKSSGNLQLAQAVEVMKSLQQRDAARRIAVRVSHSEANAGGSNRRLELHDRWLARNSTRFTEPPQDGEIVRG